MTSSPSWTKRLRDRLQAEFKKDPQLAGEASAEKRARRPSIITIVLVALGALITIPALGLAFPLVLLFDLKESQPAFVAVVVSGFMLTVAVFAVAEVLLAILHRSKAVSVFSHLPADDSHIACDRWKLRHGSPRRKTELVPFRTSSRERNEFRATGHIRSRTRQSSGNRGVFGLKSGDFPALVGILTNSATWTDGQSVQHQRGFRHLVRYGRAWITWLMLPASAASGARTLAASATDTCEQDPACHAFERRTENQTTNNF